MAPASEPSLILSSDAIVTEKSNKKYVKKKLFH